MFSKWMVIQAINKVQLHYHKNKTLAVLTKIPIYLIFEIILRAILFVRKMQKIFFCITHGKQKNIELK